MADRIKRYVQVTMRTDEEGRVRPLEIQLHGKTYIVDEVLDVRRRTSTRVGGDGIRYKVRIANTVTDIFYEDPRWFVEEVAPDVAC